MPAGLQRRRRRHPFDFGAFRVAGELLQPGFSVTPCFRVALRSTLRSDPAASAIPDVDTTPTNDVQSKVHNPDDAVDPTVTDEDQDTIELRPVDGGGGGGPSMVDKFWLLDDGSPSKDAATVVALTDDQRTARLRWSTQGIPLDKMVVTDPATTPGRRAGGLTPSTSRGSPHRPPATPITFDKVDKVEISPRPSGSWVDITGQACPRRAAVTASSLATRSPAGQRSTLGVRLTIVRA